MVEIEAVDDEEPSPAPATNTTDDGWQKLMGDDLVMKVRLVIHEWLCFNDCF